MRSGFKSPSLRALPFIIFAFSVVSQQLLFEVKLKVTQPCLTLCAPMDYIVHGILQARILEWVAFTFSRIFPTPGSNPGLPHCRWILYQLSHQGSPRILEWVGYLLSSGSSRPRN